MKLDWDEHVEVTHDIWLYPLYIRYLMDKDEEDYTGDEIYVMECVKAEITDWMPLENNVSAVMKVRLGLTLGPAWQE